MSCGGCELNFQGSIKEKGAVFHWQDYINEEHNTAISQRNEKNKRTCWPRPASTPATVRLINSWLYSHRLHLHLISCFNRPHCFAFVTPARHKERICRTASENDCLIRHKAIFGAGSWVGELERCLQFCQVHWFFINFDAVKVQIRSFLFFCFFSEAKWNESQHALDNDTYQRLFVNIILVPRDHSGVIFSVFVHNWPLVLSRTTGLFCVPMSRIISWVVSCLNSKHSLQALGWP